MSLVSVACLVQMKRLLASTSTVKDDEDESIRVDLSGYHTSDETDDNKTDAEKDAENVQAILDDYAKDEATVAEGVAAKRMRVENLLTPRSLQIMEQALAGFPGCKELHDSVNDQASLVLAWEKALLNDITHEAHDAFESAIERAERSCGPCWPPSARWSAEETNA